MINITFNKISVIVFRWMPVRISGGGKQRTHRKSLT